MYVNLKSGTDENSVIYTPVGDFADANYWSSSENTMYHAWVQVFPGGVQDGFRKEWTAMVRAVRAF